MCVMCQFIIAKIEMVQVRFLGQGMIRVREKVYFHKNNMQLL